MVVSPPKKETRGADDATQGGDQGLGGVRSLNSTGASASPFRAISFVSCLKLFFFLSCFLED